MANFSMEQIKGVIPALVTCFDEREAVDVKRTRETVKGLLEFGVDGFYLTGSTGEAFLMTAEERKIVVETVIDEVNGRVPVIVHVGDIGTKLSVDLAVHAEQAGADAISSVPPFYWKFGPENIYRYYEELAGSVSLPMIIYNIALAGTMDASLLERLGRIPNVKGLKFTSLEHFRFPELKKTFGNDFVIYSGADEMALSGLSFGADGIIGSFYNVIPDVYLKLFQAVKRGDLKTAREMQVIADRIIMTALKYDYIPLIKRMMSWMGLDGGYSRRPFTRYDKKTEDAVKEEFLKLKEELKVTGVAFLDNLR